MGRRSQSVVVQLSEDHHLDVLQGECVVAACSAIRSSASLISLCDRLRAGRQSSHLFTWRVKAYWRAVPNFNVYTNLCVLPTGQ